VSLTPVNSLPPVDPNGHPLVANIIANFSNYSKMALMGVSGAQGKLIPEEKPRDTIPLKVPTYRQR
jgi:hypothetical protein